MKLTRHILDGLIAGAAGTTALDAATYLDMSVRGRPTSSTPEDTVEKLASIAGASVPGSGETQENRVSGLGALNGILAGTLTGGAIGAVRGLGLRPPLLFTAVAATLGVMALTDGLMAGLGVTDPRDWSATDWAADVLPHLAYGLTLAVALERQDRSIISLD